MTYLHINDQGSSRHALGTRRIERRKDCVTEEKIHDALRARGMAAAAQALDFQCVDVATAMRVLTTPTRRCPPVPHRLRAASTVRPADGETHFAALPANA